MGYASGNFSDFERQKQKGSTVTDYNAVDANNEVHRVMMELEPLLETLGKRNWRSFKSTHNEFSCHCLLQTWWYPGRSNLVLISNCRELLSMGLPDSSQPITCEYQLDIGAGAFKRAFVIHWNAVTTAVKRTSRTSECDGSEKEEMLKEDLERNVTLCLHNSFCRKRESNVDPLPCGKQRLEEQKCWRTASNSVRKATDVLQDTETESAVSMSQEEEMEH